MKNPKKYIQAIFGVAAFSTSIIAIFLLLTWITAVPSSLKNLSWQKSTGFVARAFVITKPCGNRNHDIDLEYSYTFRGVSYVGSKLGGASKYYFFYSDCGLSLMKRLSPNLANESKKQADVYVNPNNPSEAVLIKGLPPFVKPAKWIVISFILWGIVFLLRK